MTSWYWLKMVDQVKRRRVQELRPSAATFARRSLFSTSFCSASASCTEESGSDQHYALGSNFGDPTHWRRDYGNTTCHGSILIFPKGSCRQRDSTEYPADRYSSATSV